MKKNMYDTITITCSSPAIWIAEDKDFTGDAIFINNFDGTFTNARTNELYNVHTNFSSFKCSIYKKDDNCPWIAVSNELFPKELSRVQITYIDSNGEAKCDKIVTYSEGQWRDNDSFIDNVIAWKLPCRPYQIWYKGGCT